MATIRPRRAGVLIPTFAIRTEDDLGIGDAFGFCPHSRSIHILGEGRTWFFDAKGNYHGWIAGERVGDAADGKGMIFRMKDGRSATVSPDLKVTRTERFTLADGRKILPLELHPDIGLGVFAVQKKSARMRRNPAMPNRCQTRAAPCCSRAGSRCRRKSCAPNNRSQRIGACKRFSSHARAA